MSFRIFTKFGIVSSSTGRGALFCGLKWSLKCCKILSGGHGELLLLEFNVVVCLLAVVKSLSSFSCCSQYIQFLRFCFRMLISQLSWTFSNLFTKLADWSLIWLISDLIDLMSKSLILLLSRVCTWTFSHLIPHKRLIIIFMLFSNLSLSIKLISVDLFLQIYVCSPSQSFIS